MNILFLPHRIPYPPEKGDKIRSFNELLYLSRRCNIYLGTTLDHESDRDYISILRRYCREIYAVHFNRRKRLSRSFFSGKPFSVSNFYDNSLQEYVDYTLRHKIIDAVICFCSSMAEYIFQNPLYKMNRLAGIRLIMDFVDMDSDKWAQYAKYARVPLGTIYRIENRRLFDYETRINREFHQSIFVSEREVKIFKKHYPEADKVRVIPNGVDYHYFCPSPTNSLWHSKEKSPEPILVFTGVMDYFANEDGVNWFCRKIFPLIRLEVPRVRLFIVGKRPTRTVRNLSRMDGVTVTGHVNDIRKYYWMADVCVIPLRIARGLQNKVLEAMATGNAVVTTSNARDGITCRDDSDIVIADDEKNFAEKVISLLKSPHKRIELGKNAVKTIRHNYSWQKNLQPFDDILGL